MYIEHGAIVHTFFICENEIKIQPIYIYTTTLQSRDKNIKKIYLLVFVAENWKKKYLYSQSVKLLVQVTE